LGGLCAQGACGNRHNRPALLRSMKQRHGCAGSAALLVLSMRVTCGCSLTIHRVESAALLLTGCARVVRGAVGGGALRKICVKAHIQRF
jgi:hypothetical protein